MFPHLTVRTLFRIRRFLGFYGSPFQAFNLQGFRKKLLGGAGRNFPRLVIFTIAFLLYAPAHSQTPTCSASQYAEGGQGCYYPPTASTDTCPGNGVTTSNLQTEAINQFYTYGASGVSVLYCGGNNGNGTSTITMQCVPPPNATIVSAFLEVVEEAFCVSCADNSPMVFAGGTLAAGTEVGQVNYENDWNDPRYGPDVQGGNWGIYFWNIRYAVPVNLVAGGTSTYALANLPNFSVSESLVIVYTVPAPGICSAVALGDGLIAWDDGETKVLNYGITPSGSTLDWGCADSNPSACASSGFSLFGGSDNTGTSPPSFSDQFLSAPTGGTVLASEPDCGFQNACGTEEEATDFSFETTYSSIPAFSGTDKVTWALGDALDSTKENYWVNLLAASCAAPCATPTPTFTLTNTPTGTW
ncbi:MAG TPA: hypothetical protein VK859_02365, partial [bacterium]|nr:hypothetical protein [bacterium]